LGWGYMPPSDVEQVIPKSQQSIKIQFKTTDNKGECEKRRFSMSYRNNELCVTVNVRVTVRANADPIVL